MLPIDNFFQLILVSWKIVFYMKNSSIYAPKYVWMSNDEVYWDFPKTDGFDTYQKIK